MCVRHDNISSSDLDDMKKVVVRYAKTFRDYTESTTPLEWSADFSEALPKNIVPWLLQEVSQLLVTWKVTGLKLGDPEILMSLFPTSKWPEMLNLSSLAH